VRECDDSRRWLCSARPPPFPQVTLAAGIFSSCSLARAYVMLREALGDDVAPLGPISTVVMGVMLPELLPTIAALLVLRRQPLTCCAGSRMSDGGMDGWTGREAGPCSCLERCWPWRSVSGVDMRPLRDTEGGF